MSDPTQPITGRNTEDLVRALNDRDIENLSKINKDNPFPFGESHFLVSTAYLPESDYTDIVFDGKDLEDITNYRSANLPSLETLPDELQAFIDNLDELESYEKLNLIQDYTNNFMQYDLEGVKKQLEAANASRDSYGSPDFNAAADGVLTFDALFSKPLGDCDDYAQATMALLHYAGFSPDDVAFGGGVASYSKVNTDGSHEKIGAVGHAVTLVNVGNEFYMLDMNLQDPVLLSKSDNFRGFHAEGMSRDDINVSGSNHAQQSENIYIVFSPSIIIPADEKEQLYCNKAIFRTLHPDATLPRPIGLSIPYNSQENDDLTNEEPKEISIKPKPLIDLSTDNVFKH